MVIIPIYTRVSRSPVCVGADAERLRMSRALSETRARRLHSWVSRAPARCPPPLQRRRAFIRRQAKQEPLDRDILIEVGPVDADARSISSQRRRSLGRPSASRGYHSIGTDTLRPSRNSTTSACSVNLNVLGRCDFPLPDLK